ncbi:MAG: DUF1311 domain-containing protein [Acetatifactor sp.]|nr:DUF1311 domain-containing protein [Acetatifactor sp.]
MKKRTVSIWCVCLATLMLAGCGAKAEIEEQTQTVAEQDETVEQSETEEDTVTDKEFVVDYAHDYTAEIQEEVKAIVLSSTSLQEELEKVEQLSERYLPLATQAQTQAEMNQAAGWFYTIWGTELNDLWSRISNQADEQTKERLLAEQRNWVSMKEEITLEYYGPAEENGSMYPTLYSSFWENNTRNRCYILASELAGIQGESFLLPDKSTKYGVFVDNQGTGSVYSSLITRTGWEGDDEAIVSIYRLIALEGSFTDNGDGTLSFRDEECDVEGIITIAPWNGASFEVTASPEDFVVSVGETFEFDFVF